MQVVAESLGNSAINDSTASFAPTAANASVLFVFPVLIECFTHHTSVSHESRVAFIQSGGSFPQRTVFSPRRSEKC